MTDNKSITKQTQREKSKAKRREAIISIARTSFLENGYEDTTMSLIAKNMGGSKGTLWSYFSTKEELFAAVLQSVASTFRAFMDTVLDPEKEVLATLTDFCRAFVVRITSPQAIAIQRIVISQAEKIPEVAKIFYEYGPAYNHAIISGYLKKQMTAGKIPENDAGDAAKMLLNLCTSGYHDLVLYGAQERDDSMAGQQSQWAVTLFWHCYGKE